MAAANGAALRSWDAKIDRTATHAAQYAAVVAIIRQQEAALDDAHAAALEGPILPLLQDAEAQTDEWEADDEIGGAHPRAVAPQVPPTSLPPGRVAAALVSTALCRAEALWETQEAASAVANLSVLEGTDAAPSKRPRATLTSSLASLRSTASKLKAISARVATLRLDDGGVADGPAMMRTGTAVRLAAAANVDAAETLASARDRHSRFMNAIEFFSPMAAMGRRVGDLYAAAEDLTTVASTPVATTRTVHTRHDDTTRIFGIAPVQASVRSFDSRHGAIAAVAPLRSGHNDAFPPMRDATSIEQSVTPHQPPASVRVSGDARPQVAGPGPPPSPSATDAQQHRSAPLSGAGRAPSPVPSPPDIPPAASTSVPPPSGDAHAVAPGASASPPPPGPRLVGAVAAAALMQQLMDRHETERAQMRARHTAALGAPPAADDDEAQTTWDALLATLEAEETELTEKQRLEAAAFYADVSNRFSAGVSSLGKSSSPM